MNPEIQDQIAAPIDKSSVAQGAVAVPVTKTGVTQSPVSAPVTKTGIAQTAVSAPVTKSSVAQGAIAVPVTKTSVSQAAIAAPVNLTAQAVAAFPRSITPLLDLDFANNLYSQNGVAEALSGILTYSRSSSATYINRRKDKLGRWEYYLENDFVGTVTNLLTYSEDFSNAAWESVGSATKNNKTKTLNGIVLRELEDGTSNDGQIRQAFTTTANNTLNFSIDALFGDNKTNPHVEIGVNISGGTTNFAGVIVNLKSGVITNTRVSGSPNITVGMHHKGGGVYRINITITDTGGNTSGLVIIRPSFNFTGSSSIDNSATGKHYFGAAQLTQSAKPLSYVKTISTSASQVSTAKPRLEYNPATGESLGFLVEGASTNLALRSEEFDNASWTKSNSSVTANQAISPDGTKSADLLLDNATNGTHSTTQTMTLTANTTYTLSVFAKMTSNRYLILQTSNVANWSAEAKTVFDLQIGVVASSLLTDYSIENVGGGWYRCSITATFGAATTIGGLNIFTSEVGTLSSYSGTGKGVYIWGAQIEAQPFATSYIRTEGATVSRSADNTNAPLYSDLKGVSLRIIASTKGITTVSSHHLASFESDTNNRVSILSSSITGYARLFINNNSITQADLTSNISLNNRFTDIVANLNDNASLLYVDGSLKLSDLSCLQPSINIIRLGSFVGGSPMFGHIKKLAVYDKTLTAQEISLL